MSSNSCVSQVLPGSQCNQVVNSVNEEFRRKLSFHFLPLFMFESLVFLPKFFDLIFLGYPADFVKIKIFYDLLC